jgi:hypothetical protein
MFRIALTARIIKVLIGLAAADAAVQSLIALRRWHRQRRSTRKLHFARRLLDNTDEPFQHLNAGGGTAAAEHLTDHPYHSAIQALVDAPTPACHNCPLQKPKDLLCTPFHYVDTLEQLRLLARDLSSVSPAPPSPTNPTPSIVGILVEIVYV